MSMSTENANVPTAQLIAAMLQQRDKVSDLIFSPGRPPQVESKGELVPLPFRGLEVLSTAQTQQIAEDLIGTHAIAAAQLRDTGSADLSYAIPGLARFRVNCFRQRGTYAVVMRLIPVTIPSFQDLGLPEVLAKIVGLRNGIV